MTRLSGETALVFAWIIALSASLAVLFIGACVRAMHVACVCMCVRVCVCV